jgi:hypothetical protein
MDPDRGPLILVGVILLGLAGLGAASGLLQAAPTAGTVKIADHSATSSWSSSGAESATWTPSEDARFAGLSVKIRDATGGGPSPRQVGVVVSCGDVDLWNGYVAANVDGAGKWVTATSAALIAKQGLNVTAGASCAIEISFDGSLVDVATGSSPAFVIWGFPSEDAGPAPGAPSGSSPTSKVSPDDEPGNPEDDAAVLRGMLGIAVVVIAIVLGAVLLLAAFLGFLG